MAKTQPKIDDIKDLKKATITSDGLMSADDKIKLDSAYKLKGNIANKTALLALTNIKKGDVYNAQNAFNLINGDIVQKVKVGDNIVCLSDADTSVETNWDNLSGNVDKDVIKQGLGLIDYNYYNRQDIFISGIQTTSHLRDFNSIVYIGSYKINGTYDNAPSQNCGTNTGTTANMKGTLNVFRSGVNDWETIQQLFWVLNGKTEQYQRSYDGTTWTVWKRLIKCDDYATSERGGIISPVNLQELFRAPDIIQLWNTDDSPQLGVGTYYLDTFLPIHIAIQNAIELQGGNGNKIVGLNSGRVYRVTYDVFWRRWEGDGNITIRIEDGNGELHSMTDYISDNELRNRITFSVMLTNLDFITPVIEVDSKLVIQIYPACYQISVEEIKFPLFTPHNN